MAFFPYIPNDISIRCPDCGGPMDVDEQLTEAEPDQPERRRYFIKCTTQFCPEQGKRFALPQIALNKFS